MGAVIATMMTTCDQGCEIDPYGWWVLMGIIALGYGCLWIGRRRFERKWGKYPDSD